MENPSLFNSSLIQAEDKYNKPEDSYTIDEKYNKEYQNKGRVDIKAGENGTPLFLHDLIPKNEKTNYSNAMSHDHPSTLLSTTYFSLDNIQIIQNGIRSGVYEMSNKKYIIDEQDYDTIKTIMRSVYLQYSLNQDNNIREQVSALNKLVLEYSVPKVYNELLSYIKFRRDISTLSTPIEAPSLMTVDKTVELKNFF